MDVETAKRVVAIQRQKAAYKALERSGKLTADECSALVGYLDVDLELIRSQGTLPFKAAVEIAPLAGATPPQGGKKGA